MSNPTTATVDLAIVQELLDVLLQCEAPRHMKRRAVDAADAARRLIATAIATPVLVLTSHKPAARQGWDVCARQQSGRLIDDLMSANREAGPLESLLLLPLLAQARDIHNQLGAIVSAIDATPEN